MTTNNTTPSIISGAMTALLMMAIFLIGTLATFFLFGWGVWFLLLHLLRGFS